MYEIYLGDLKLPLLPENLKENINRDNKKHNILALGEVVEAGYAKLRTWQVKSDFWHEDIDVTYARDYILSLIYSDDKITKPIRFIVNRYNDDGSLTFDTNCLVLIDSITFEDKEADVGNLSYTINLIEYREYGSRIVQ